MYFLKKKPESLGTFNEHRRRNTIHIWGGTFYFCYRPCMRRAHDPTAAYYNEQTIKYWRGYSPQSPPVPTPMMSESKIENVVHNAQEPCFLHVPEEF